MRGGLQVTGDLRAATSDKREFSAWREGNDWSGVMSVDW